MEKNLKRIIAVILVIVMIIACVGCGETSGDKTPTKDTEKYDNVGYPISEQTFEKRVSRLFDEYVITQGFVGFSRLLDIQYKIKKIYKFPMGKTYDGYEIKNVMEVELLAVPNGEDSTVYFWYNERQSKFEFLSKEEYNNALIRNGIKK